MLEESLESKFNEAHFNSILSCVEEITEINEKNQSLYVEVIRNLSEFVIFGERADKNYFE